MQSILFKKITPDDKDLLDQTFRLRFQVYGSECNFIDKRLYPDGLESDRYDSDSVHFAAVNSFGEAVASVRLILGSQVKLPVWQNYPSGKVGNVSCSDDKTAELSRLVISKRLLEQRCRGWIPSGKRNISSLRQRLFSRGRFFWHDTKPVTFGLYREVYKECIRRGISHIAALMEPGLFTLLKMYGFHFRCIGPTVDVFGPVSPYIGQVADFQQALNRYQYPAVQSSLQLTN